MTGLSFRARSKLASARDLRRYLPVGLAAALGLTLTLYAFRSVRTWEADTAQAEFDDRVAVLAGDMRRDLEDVSEVLGALTAFFEASKEVERDEFTTFARPLLLSHPEVEFLEWVPRVPAAARPALEQYARSQGYPAFEIMTATKPGEPARAPPRPEYFPVLWVAADADQEPAVGFDLGSEPGCWAVLDQTPESETGTATARATAVHLIDGEPGVRILLPVYGYGAPPDFQKCPAKLSGFVVSALHPHCFVERRLASWKTDAVDVRLFDGDRAGERQLLYAHMADGPGARPDERATQLIRASAQPVGWDDQGEDTWQLECTPGWAYRPTAETWSAWAVLAGGGLLTALLSVYLLLALSRHRRVEQLVSARTAELTAANQKLLGEVAERKQAEDAVRRQSELLVTILANIPHFVFWKDRNSVYLGCNANFARVAGLTNPAEIIGKTDYDLAWKRSEAEGYRQHDQEVMAQNEPLLDIEECQLQADGRETGILTSKVPLHDAEGHVAGILGIFADITERKREEEALRTHFEQIERERANLQAVFDSAQVGFLLHNEQMEVIRVNDAAARLVGKDSAEMVGHQPGDALCCIHAAAAPNGCGTAEACSRCPIRSCLTRVLRTGEPVRGLEVNQVLQINGEPRSLWLSIGATIVKLNDLRCVLVAITDITERKRAEEALRQSEERFRLAAQSITNLVWEWDITTGQLDWFGDIDGLLGYVPGDFEHNIAAWKTLLVPDDHDRVLAALERHFTAGVPYDEEYRVRRKDGGICHWHVRGTAIRDAQGSPVRMFGAVEDITARKRAEAERERHLVRQQGVSHLRQLLLAPAPLEAKLRTITDGIVQLFDADFCRIWLIRAGDLCGQGCFHAQAREGPHVCRQRDRCLHLLSSSGRYTHIDGPVHRRVPLGCYRIGRIATDQGRGFLTNNVLRDLCVHNLAWARELGLVSFAGYRLHAPDGDTLGVLALFAKHPLSVEEDAMLDGLGSTVALVVQQAAAEETLRLSKAELEHANEQLHQVSAQAQQMAVQADAATRAKSEFLANMSHEIRTPMTAILGYIDIMLEQGCVESAAVERLEAAKTVKRNAAYLLQLIDDILDLSKIEAGKMAVECIACAPCQLIAEVMSLVRVRADAKGLTLKFEYAGPIPEQIQTDPTRLRQILINLLGNAIKFTEVGGVRLVTRCVADGAEPRLEFGVVDTGGGMTDAQAARLFQPFVQADTSTTRKSGGTGLGLAISQRLAHLLGGEITVVETRPNAGTHMRLTVRTGPLAGIRMLTDPLTATVLLPDKTQAQNDADEEALRGCRILLAEDGPDNQRLIAYLLTKAGAAVTVVDNGQLATEAVLTAHDEGRSFDAILMDMQMPVMDGYEAAGHLRRMGCTRPIIALTAHAMEGDRRKCLDAGCDDFATKPIDRKKLIAAIRKNLQLTPAAIP